MDPTCIPPPPPPPQPPTNRVTPLPLWLSPMTRTWRPSHVTDSSKGGGEDELQLETFASKDAKLKPEPRGTQRYAVV